MRGQTFQALVHGVSLLVLLCAGVLAGSAARAESAVAYIVSPAHGSVVRSPVRVVFGLSGMGVAPAGVQAPATGHHHLLIDTPMPTPSQAIPSDAQHRHFGGGQTETWLTLTPGRHTLQLIMGDYAHVPHRPAVASEVVHITVVE